MKVMMPVCARDRKLIRRSTSFSSIKLYKGEEDKKKKNKIERFLFFTDEVRLNNNYQARNIVILEIKHKQNDTENKSYCSEANIFTQMHTVPFLE